MILVTGGTGFIGQSLVDHLLKSGQPVRILVHPSSQSPNLPRGIRLDVAVSSLTDEPGLRAAMQGVDLIFHLAGSGRLANPAALTAVDVQGTQAVVNAANKMNISRLIFLSLVTADRNSHFAAFKAKAQAENILQRSHLNFTILRSTTVFGPQDNFTSRIAKIMQKNPLFFLMPGNGDVTLQPLFIQDLITCLVLAIQDERTFRRTMSIGGGEYFSYKRILKIIMQKLGNMRVLIPFSPAYLRSLNLWLNKQEQGTPYPNAWLDYLAADRTCALDTLPKFFSLLPARFEKELGYLKNTRRLGSN
jgi:nucleoside-diphosphate-sugar epimerase